MKTIKKITAGLCFATILLCSTQIHSASEFIVRNIKVTGLQRISVGTVLNYLPVQVGEEIGPASTAEIIKALYDTGFFQFVSLERQGNTLIVNVVERATIGEITIVGNVEIPSDKMKELLKQMGLVKGRVFQRAALERLEKELKQAYNERGKYNSTLHTKVVILTENRVAITITISEGRVSRIKEIRFIGNHDFSSNELVGEMSLSTSGLLTYFNKKDQYSKGLMDASLEAIRSYYLDRGYLRFNIISSQVMLSPDKKDVYINIHIHEGPQYRFSGYAFAGNVVLPKEKMDALIQVKKGDVFSRKKVTESISALGLALGDIGYGFPAINADPKINDQDKTVFITFIVDPGRHVYVRRINFHGNVKTADYVLRRIIRQNEGSLLSLHNIKESERQIRMLGYLKDINVKTTPVPGANNQVDLDVQVEEAPSAEANASLGYGTNGFQFNAGFNQHNFMGTGRSLGVGFNTSNWGQDYSLNYYNPFYTQTGVGRGFNFYYQTLNPKNLNVSSYSSDRLGGDVNYNILLGDRSSVQFGFGYQNLAINSVGMVQQIQNFVNLNGYNFNELRLMGGWNRNSYDRVPFPTIGSNQQLKAWLVAPANSESLSYYKGSYAGHIYYPIGHGFIFSLLGNVAFGDSFNHQGLPFFENYYAGGTADSGQVRGYSSFSLGPLATVVGVDKEGNVITGIGNALGGNLLTTASAAIILPYPLSRDNLRTSVFADAGNVFAVGVPEGLSGIDGGPLRFSGGVSLEWRSPFGPLAFSLAKAINPQKRDKLEFFQFTLSSSF
jgi:outer membrane protein insertion porin family